MSIINESARGLAARPRGPWRKFGGAARGALSLVAAAGTVVFASLVVFVALAFAPGDPVTQILGGRATDEARAALREELGLDDPVIARFATWFLDVLQGDLGRSYVYRQDVTELLGSRAGITLALVLMAATLTLVVGLLLGLVGGVAPRIRPVINAITSVGISIPAFVASAFLISIFAVGFGWFPTFGAGGGGLERILHLTLPSVALSLGYGAYLARIASAVVAEEAERDFVFTSIGRGVSRAGAIRRHVIPNATLPVLTVAGLLVAGLLAGAVVVEQAFAIDGLGSLLVASVFSKDYPVVMAISLIVIVIFVAVTAILDIVQVILDPRQRRR